MTPTANEQKMAIKFRIPAADVAALVAAGFDTPRKVKDADPGKLPPGLADKLTRWHEKKKDAPAKVTGSAGSDT